jgi:hypothetical protein
MAANAAVRRGGGAVVEAATGGGRTGPELRSRRSRLMEAETGSKGERQIRDMCCRNPLCYCSCKRQSRHGLSPCWPPLVI